MRARVSLAAHAVLAPLRAELKRADAILITTAVRIRETALRVEALRRDGAKRARVVLHLPAAAVAETLVRVTERLDDLALDDVTEVRERVERREARDAVHDRGGERLNLVESGPRPRRVRHSLPVPCEVRGRPGEAEFGPCGKDRTDPVEPRRGDDTPVLEQHDDGRAVGRGQPVEGGGRTRGIWNREHARARRAAAERSERFARR